MIQAERDDYAMKQARKAEEDRIERQFRQQMMDKFKEDERLEQLSQQKRRMKELQFKKDVRERSSWDLRWVKYVTLLLYG